MVTLRRPTAATTAVKQIARQNLAATPHAQIDRASARVARIAADDGDDKQAEISADRAVEIAVLAAALPPWPLPRLQQAPWTVT
ncbi:hypothetical protein PG984_014357 [Apiospora sp. TS-2023a]